MNIYTFFLAPALLITGFGLATMLWGFVFDAALNYPDLNAESA